MGVFEDVLAQTSAKPEGFSGVLERRRENRTPTLRTSHTSLTSNLWELELLSPMATDRLAGEIDDLSTRSLESNIFFESEFIRSAWPRLTSLLADGGCWMLCLWETLGGNRKLQLFMPVTISKTVLLRTKVIRPLSNEYMTIGTPLIDAENAGEAAEVLLRLMADPALNLPQILDFTHQRKDSETFAVLQEAANNLGLKNAETITFERAALIGQDGQCKVGLSAKRLRELRRQRRKLEEDGSLTFTCARGQEEVLDAFEGFMTLELHGWKGRRGTALYNHKKIAAFSRQIVAELAVRKGCEIFTLKQGDHNIAVLITLGRNGRIVPWKMAFDESFSASSPGMQVMLEATQSLLKRTSFIEADSLATANHWMMNRIWPDRIMITDLSVALTPAGSRELPAYCRAKTRTHETKNKLRKLAVSMGLLKTVKTA